MADVFVLPTSYDGFTLVTLEAMHYGVPVISTDTSSIREGVGDAGLLAPVNDVPALTDALEKVLTDELLRELMVRRGKIQSQRFTWQECARQTLVLYREVGAASAMNGTAS
jgi:O-antigen biosynthesis alpha-1,3-mannosyltransferase